MSLHPKTFNPTIETFKDLPEKMKHLNMLQMTRLDVAKWIRHNSNLSLTESIIVGDLVKEAHRLGEIRGRALK